MTSDYLFATPSFLRGAARVFDPFGLPEPYNWSRTPQEADATAMVVDWAVVAQDLANAVAEFGAPDANQLSLFGASDEVSEKKESR